MSVIREAVSRLDDENMTVAVREAGPNKDAFFISDDFACQVPMEGPAVEAFSGNRDYETLLRAHDTGNLNEIPFEDVDLDLLADQLELSQNQFARGEVDLEGIMQNDGIDFGDFSMDEGFGRDD